MDDELADANYKAANLVLADLDSGISDISDKYGIFGLELEAPPSAGYVARMKQKRLKGTLK